MSENRDRDIAALLAEVEAQQGVRILYACESGSRAWGFASPDSDYDIRFLYVQPTSRYLRVFGGSDTIEIAIEDDLDPGGWDVRKAAGLLGKSNGALVEWLHSPIVYRAEPGFLETWRASCQELFSPKDSAFHYRGLAMQIWQGKCGGETVRAKDYLYVLRALFAARWVLDHREPAPVAFGELRGSALQGEVDELLEWKARSGEKEPMARMSEIDRAIGEGLAAIGAELEKLPSRCANLPLVEQLFRQTLRLGGEKTAADYTESSVRKSAGLLFDTVAGSRAYGTDNARSDEDRRGVFVAPAEVMNSFDPVVQVSDEKSDEVYYELRRFGELLVKNNPNALELLAMPPDCIRTQHPAFALLTPELFLSKLCGQTFGNYAMGQVRKARGLNKKIVNPEPEKRKALLDYCFVLEQQGSVPVADWIASRGLRIAQCGLVGIDHAPGVFALFYDASGQLGYRGLASKKRCQQLYS